MKSEFINKDSWARTKVSSEGISFLALTLIIGFAAFNTGNNLLYLIFGLALSLVVISGIAAMINISKIDLEIESFSDFYALTPGEMWLKVYNNKKFSSYSLILKIQDNEYYVNQIKPNTSINVNVKSFFNKRGLNKMPKVILSSTYPFGFFKKWLRINTDSKEILVFPKIYNINDKTNEINYNLGEQKPTVDGQGTELKSLRKYNFGDNVKDIHWKISAKLRKLHTKEYYKETDKIIKINFSPQENRSNELEKYISKIASIFYKMVKEGYDVELITKNKTFHSNNNKNSYKNALTFLALYQN